MIRGGEKQMIVRCSKCHAKFLFPETELSGEGVWLKCGTCRNLFFLENPDFAEMNKTAPLPETTGLRPEAKPHGPGVSKPKPSAARKQAERDRLLGIWKGVGIALAILIATGTLYYFFYPGADEVFKDAAQSLPFARQLGLADKEQAAAPPSIDFLNVRERFVKNWILGDLMVIQGVAVNKTDRPASRLKIKAKLLDQAGQFIAESSSFAGDICNEEELLNLTEQEILARMANPEGSDHPNRDITPDGNIPFQIVFIRPPAKASEYIVELDSMQGLTRK